MFRMTRKMRVAQWRRKRYHKKQTTRTWTRSRCIRWARSRNSWAVMSQLSAPKTGVVHRPKMQPSESESESESESDESVPESLPAGPRPRLLGFHDAEVVHDDSTGESATITFPAFKVPRAHGRYLNRTSYEHKIFDVAKACPLPARQDINAHFEQSTAAETAFWHHSDSIEKPRLLQQVSCLQCVLKQLPCDMRLPYCSRCIRSGHGPCLVQRDLLARERWRLGLWTSRHGEGRGYTVLVRLKSDDKEI
jgi:hypothetical protein